MISMKENQNQCQFPPFTISTDHASALSCAILLNSPQDHGHGVCYLPHHHQEQQQEAGSSSQPILDQTNDNFSNNQHIGDEQKAQGSSKWMSSKMRLMRKMLGTDQILVKKQRRKQSLQDQTQPNHASSNGSDILRVCSNCNTTKTPLWRSGPQGPKSLCNACGIRQMKARRAMRAAAAAAAAGLGSSLPAAKCVTQQEEMGSSDHVDRTVPFKKRFKIVAPASSQKNLRFDDITMSLNNKLAFHQTFPQEEKDAAILLMALSCGLIHG